MTREAQRGMARIQRWVTVLQKLRAAELADSSVTLDHLEVKALLSMLRVLKEGRSATPEAPHT